MSALEDLAAASLALRRFVTCLRVGDDAGAEHARAELLARYPEASRDFPSLDTTDPETRRATIAATGSRIAMALAPDIAQYGQARYREGRYQDALGAFQLALVLMPEGPGANLLCASALKLSNARAGFFEQARRAVVLAPFDSNARTLAMRGALATRNYGAAETQARRHLLLTPGARAGWVVLARALFVGGRPEQALSPLRVARVLAPEDMDTQRAYASCLFHLGRFEEALAALEAATVLDDDQSATDPDLAFERARFARSAGQMDRAERILDALVTTDAKYAFRRRVLELTATSRDLVSLQDKSTQTEITPTPNRHPRVHARLTENSLMLSSRKRETKKPAQHSSVFNRSKASASAGTTDKDNGAPFYMLVEETNRELASRVLIAATAAECGVTSYIIPQWFAWENLPALPPGITLFKGHNRAQAGPMRRARKAGHRVAAIEEEILGVTRPDQILRVFNSGAVEVCELFLLQGSHARDVLISRYPGIEKRIRVTGNPRLDALLSPLDHPIRRNAETIRADHGEFILINTNFGSANPRLEDTVSDFETCARVGLIDPEDPVDQADYMGWCGWERQNMALLAAVIATLRARDDLPRIVIRPHPSENLKRWREAYPGDARVQVIREGEHTAWTAAARLLLHTGCTTGVEASLLGTPALSLQGGVSDWHRAHTSNFVNPTAGSVDATLDWINAVLTEGPSAGAPTPEMHAELERQLLPPGEELAAERIVSALRELSATKVGSPEDMSRAEARLARRSLLAAAHKIEAEAFTAHAVQSLASRFASALNHPAPPRVTAIGDAMIRVSPA